jgi:hypothetical protein
LDGSWRENFGDKEKVRPPQRTQHHPPRDARDRGRNPTPKSTKITNGVFSHAMREQKQQQLASSAEQRKGQRAEPNPKSTKITQGVRAKNMTKRRRDPQRAQHHPLRDTRDRGRNPTQSTTKITNSVTISHASMRVDREQKTEKKTNIKPKKTRTNKQTKQEHITDRLVQGL